jgi:NADH-quinone oxidoreductase subunit N
VRNGAGSEEIAAYRGLIRRSPLAAICMTLFLLSLLGLPPLVGFAAKFQVFAVLYDTGRHFGSNEPILGWVYLGLLIVAALNTAVSAGYYLKVVRVMMLEEPEDASEVRISSGGRAFVSLLAVLVVAAGVLWDPLTRLTDRGRRAFEKSPARMTEKRT